MRARATTCLLARIWRLQINRAIIPGMGLVIYLFGAVVFVVVASWAVYVLPTPGPLGPLELAIGMIPVFVIMGSVFAAICVFWLTLVALKWLFRAIRRAKRPLSR
jgi:vacuolar-type H+-ATPase subunit I/STV1